ncbi:MAG TPA: tetratricopeptide repeat protein [Tepidisphaeraceae bacterium]|jgi:Flp pilus assembly protein TadD
MTIDEALHHAAGLQQAGKFAEAEGVYREILKVAPTHPVALEALAGIALRFGHLQAAEQIARKALEGRTRASADAFTILGAALHQMNRKPEAAAALREAAKLAPHDAATQYNLGMICFELRLFDECLAAYTRAVELNPDVADTQHGLMSVLGEFGRFDEAVDAGKRAASLGANSPRFWSDYGIALHDIGDLRGAIEAEERSAALDPSNATAHFNLAQALLRAGDFQRGWEEHEWRWDSLGFPSEKRNLPQPMWDGSPGDKTVLVHAEQGAGDAIMAARYIPLVAQRAKVVVECQKELVDLLGSVEGAKHLIARGEALPAFDAHVPMMSLPLVFDTRVETIPQNVPYLRPDPRRVAQWGETLRKTNKLLRVGVTWAGSPTHLNDINRSTRFELMASVLQKHEADVEFYSLQKGPRSNDARGAEWLSDFTGKIRDFSDTAALLQHLDLVITVDTSVAHLAGALARDVWVMLPFAPDWRWLESHPDTSPWYPTMRLFRQSRPRQWGDVLARIETQLHLLLNTRT